MKTLNGILFLCALFLISGCIPDSFTHWNLEPPSAAGGSESGATPPSGPGGSTTPPPTSFAYTPSGPYQLLITTDASATMPDLTPISTGGGEIIPGNITFQLAQVRDINGVALPTVWPNSLSLDPTTGIISGRPNQFVNHNTYTINAIPLGAVTPIQTQVVISMASKPETIFYPQLNGRTLLLEISVPQNFKVGNFVTSEKNAKGTVTSVDEKNKNIYIVVNCTLSPGQTFCPTFNPGDKIDNKDGYFLEQSIINKVVYGYTTTTGIPTNWNWIPITNPNISGEQPQYAISPDITVNPGVHFSSATGQIWTDVPLQAPIPNTNYTVTVKNVLGQTANAIFNMQILGVSDPRSPDAVEYAYKPGSRVVLEVTDTSQFPVGGKISNQDGTSGTIKGLLTAASVTQLLIDIDPWSISDFQANQPVDNGYPYVLQATTIANKTPIFVHQIGQQFLFPPTLSGNLSPSDLDTLTWTSNPELPHLCQSIASTPTVYYKENTNAPTDPLSCTNAHGTCSIPTIINGFSCVNATPTAGSWTTSAKYLTEYANELWFNRRTGEFGAWNPQKTFPGQTFNVSVTSLTGIVLNTSTAISFEGVPKNLSYAGDVLLEVDDDSAFDIGDLITSDGNGVGMITHKFISSPPSVTPTYTPTGKILVVKASSGVFLEGEDIDNVYPFTFQKGEILQAKYNDVGVQVAGSINTFKIGEEVTSASATGIINFIQDPAYSASNTVGEPILWVRLTNTKNPPTSFTTVGGPTIKSVNGSAITTVTGIIGDNITIEQGGGTTYTPGLDVSSNFGPNGGFGMANSVSGSNVSVSVQSGRFYKDTSAPKPLFRYNPPSTVAAGQASAPINNITHNPIFYLDRYGTSGIQPVVISPPNNGVVYSINPALPEGLSFDTAKGEINVVAPGPVAATLKNYTVVASNFLGETSFTFGLAVREVFSITDITNTNGNISGIMHKSGQGYARFPCRITQDQIKSQATGNSRGKNINCLYDVGEGDLYSNGLVVQVNVGTNLCVYVQHLPYFFYQNEYLKTTPNPASATVEATGQYQNVLCGPGQPNGTTAQYPNGDPNSKCLGNQGGTQCDDGAVSTIQRDYQLEGICYDSSIPPVAGVTTFTQCFGDPNANGSTAGNTSAAVNRSYCSDNNTSKNRDACLNSNQAWNSNYAFINGNCHFIKPETDAVTCSDNYGSCAGGTGGANRNACTAGGGIWTTTGLYVANANCFSTAGVPGPDFQCGGDQANCINGPAKDDGDFPQGQLTNRFGQFIRGYTVPVGTDPIPFTYASPLSKGFLSNMYLSNFSRQRGSGPPNACTPFNGNIYEYNMSTWFNVGFNLNPEGITGVNSPFSGGNGVYSIRCLDAAANIIGQINLLIREWDHDFKAKNGVDIFDFTGAPVDASGTTDPDFGNPLNAYKDWDDNSIGGSCAAPTYTFPGGNL